MAEPTAVLVHRMLTCQWMFSCASCFLLFLENMECDTTPFLFQSEPQITLLPMAELRDDSDIANPSLVSERWLECFILC